MDDPNSFAAKVASDVAVNIFTKIFEKSLEGVESFVKWIKDETKEHDPLGIAARKYTEQMEKRYNSMRIFGMSEPVQLREIFVRVNTLEKITSSLRVIHALQCNPRFYPCRFMFS